MTTSATAQILLRSLNAMTARAFPVQPHMASEFLDLLRQIDHAIAAELDVPCLGPTTILQQAERRSNREVAFAFFCAFNQVERFAR